MYTLFFILITVITYTTYGFEEGDFPPLTPAKIPEKWEQISVALRWKLLTRYLPVYKGIPTNGKKINGSVYANLSDDDLMGWVPVPLQCDVRKKNGGGELTCKISVEDLRYSISTWMDENRYDHFSALHEQGRPWVQKKELGRPIIGLLTMANQVNRHRPFEWSLHERYLPSVEKCYVYNKWNECSPEHWQIEITQSIVDDGPENSPKKMDIMRTYALDYALLKNKATYKLYGIEIPIGLVDQRPCYRRIMLGKSTSL